jgi:hypothetical protein
VTSPLSLRQPADGRAPLRRGPLCGLSGPHSGWRLNTAQRSAFRRIGPGGPKDTNPCGWTISANLFRSRSMEEIDLPLLQVAAASTTAQMPARAIRSNDALLFHAGRPYRTRLSRPAPVPWAGLFFGLEGTVDDWSGSLRAAYPGSSRCARSARRDCCRCPVLPAGS